MGANDPSASGSRGMKLERDGDSKKRHRALAAAQPAQLPPFEKFVRLGKRQPLFHDRSGDVGGAREGEAIPLLLHLELEALAKAA